MEQQKAELVKHEFFRDAECASAMMTVFEDMKDTHFFVKNAECQIVAANKIFARLMGGEKECDIIGKDAWDLCAPVQARQYEDDDHSVMNTGKAIINRLELNRSTDGTINWFVTSKFPLRNRCGEVIGLVGLTREMEESRKLFEASDVFASIMRHIAEHSHEEITVPQLAGMVNMSRSSFQAKFKDFFGMPPARFINNYRLDHASKLLSDTNKGIAEIAMEVGFYDHSAFTKRFAKAFGMNPKEFRKRSRQPRAGAKF